MNPEGRNIGMDDEKKNRRKYEPPVSLHPLDPEDALRAFLAVDPEKVKERERTEKAGEKPKGKSQKKSKGQ